MEHDDKTYSVNLDDITDLEYISGTCECGMSKHEFTAMVKGEKTLIHYTEEYLDDIDGSVMENYSFKTDGTDLFKRMSYEDASQFCDILHKGMLVSIYSKQIDEAETLQDLKRIRTEFLCDHECNLISEQFSKLYRDRERELTLEQIKNEPAKPYAISSQSDVKAFENETFIKAAMYFKDCGLSNDTIMLLRHFKEETEDTIRRSHDFTTMDITPEVERLRAKETTLSKMFIQASICQDSNCTPDYFLGYAQAAYDEAFGNLENQSNIYIAVKEQDAAYLKKYFGIDLEACPGYNNDIEYQHALGALEAMEAIVDAFEPEKDYLHHDVFEMETEKVIKEFNEKNNPVRSDNETEI